jgi:hypothetical protein
MSVGGRTSCRGAMESAAQSLFGYAPRHAITALN